MRINKDFALFTKYVSMNMLSMIALACYFLADTYFIANGVGSGGIVALNIVLPVFSVMHGIGHMFGIGGASLFSIRKSNDDKAGSRIFTEVAVIGVVIGIVITVIALVFPRQIIRLLGGEESIVELAKTYLTTIVIYAPFFILNNTVVAFVRNDNDPKLSMIAMIVASLSNVLLDYIFIYPMKLGMFGAALATGLSPIFSLLICSFHFIKNRSTFTLSKCRFNGKEILKSMTLGAQALIGELASGVVILLFNMAMLKYVGDMGVAAYGIIANIVLVAIALFNGIGQGMQPILSDAYGSGQTERIKRALIYGVVLSTVLGMLVLIFGTVFDGAIVKIFNKDGGEELQRIAERGIDVYFIAFLFSGINIVLTFFYGATSRAVESMVISLLRGVVGVFVFIMILPRFIGVDGIWATTPVAEGLTFVAAVVYTVFFVRNIYGKQRKTNEADKKSDREEDMDVDTLPNTDQGDGK